MEEREYGREKCSECLQRQMDSDFQQQQQQQNQGLPLFCYALSPRSAVVEISPHQSQTATQPTHGSASSTATSRFILTQLIMPTSTPTCFTSYLDECISAPDPSNGSANDALAPSVVASQSSSCTCTGLFSCPSRKIINALAPLARVATCSPSLLQDVASHFLSGTLEQHVLHSLSLFVHSKSSPLESLNFLRLLGLPDFPDYCIPSCLRHPNLVPVLSLLKSSHFVYALLPSTPYTLENVLHYSPNALKSEWHLKFLLYQLLSALAYLHGLGVSHGNLCPSNVMLTDSLWVWLNVFDTAPMSVSSPSPDSTSSAAFVRAHCCMDDCSSRGLYADLKLSFSVDWPSQFHRWWKGELSNFEYLLVLNRLAGRRWGDHAFHTVMPWVIDFSIKPDDSSDLGWRDLSKSKWRLAKGDEQLDFTYSTSELPHHVSDECLSDLAVCSYKARRLPLRVLRLAVRSVYEPNEYPSTMQRLYQWTPDECIPEFYCDPRIFYSIHSGMADLAVPSWASSPEDFIKVHRDALESCRISRQIHHWIDITFGYKMSGQAAIAAKNVMLSSSELTKPRSLGRRQLFTKPHPARRLSVGKVCDTSSSRAWSSCQPNGAEDQIMLLSETAYLQPFEEAAAFTEHATHLSPRYSYDLSHCENGVSCVEELASKGFGTSTPKALEIMLNNGIPSDICVSYVLEHMESNLDSSMGYQELLLWKQKSYCSRNLSEDLAKDIFSVGCILAELFLKRPLFNSTTLTPYIESGIVPGLIEELPPHIKGIVEACINHDWTRRPTAKCILESPYFDSTVKASYLFVAPLHLLGEDGTRLEYAANFAKKGALKSMGSFAAEMCAPYCLHLVVSPQSDIEAEWASILLREFIKCLTSKAVKTLVLPAIQKILQTSGYSHLKVLLLQGSFVQELWNVFGKQVYLDKIHPLVISNLSASPHKSSAAVASVLLICTSEELGVPITINQTILPLISCFGKGLCSDGIDVLVRIGSLLGETFIVNQILPLIKQVIRSCINASHMTKPEPVQSWCALALIDCLTTLDGLVALLPEEVVVKELIEDRNCVHVSVIMQANLDVSVLQIAASTLVGICHRIGPDLTASHVLPQLKELFDELAFSQEIANGSGSFGKSLKTSKTIIDGEAQIENRKDLVLLLYPSFASLLGIEKLRQCCATWLLLEQFLLRCHNWKWECTVESSRSGLEGTAARRSFKKASTSEYNPAKLLLNGVGWSIPQSQGSRSTKILSPQRQFDAAHQSLVEGHLTTTSLSNREPWFWFPTPADGWDGLDFLGRVGTLKDELPWKIRASIIYSIRAHQGALRSLAVSQDECSVYTAGMGSGFKGGVQRWELSKINCISGYYGHEEVVNDICVLSSNGRIASCDGTIHVWNSRTGKALSVFSEPSVDSTHLGSPLTSTSKISLDHSNSQNSNTLSNALLTTTFDGSLYTCIHRFGSPETLIAGTGNGSIRFIDVTRGQKLHMWRGESVESSFPSFVSAICSCESEKLPSNGSSTSPTWIAVGLGSGHCRLFDSRNGSLIASWRAHDGYVTKLAAPEGHLLVSSSFDRTLRIWDLRRNLPMQATVVKGHNDSVSDFALWGQDVISVSRNKIGVSALSKLAQEDEQQKIIPQKLFFADNGTKSLSVLTSICILPFSRVFVVGTEDGYLRICC